MKKILALVLVLCMVLALCACGAKGVTGLTAEEMAPAEPAASAAEPAAEQTQAAPEENGKSEGVMTYAQYAAAELDSEVRSG